MLSLQTIKKWSDARLRKALPGWSLDYTHASSHPKLSSCPQFLYKTYLMLCLNKYQNDTEITYASSFTRLSAVVPHSINKFLFINRLHFAQLVPDSMTSRVKIFITWKAFFRKVQVLLRREHHCIQSYNVSENTIELARAGPSKLPPCEVNKNTTSWNARGTRSSHISLWVGLEL